MFNSEFVNNLTELAVKEERTMNQELAEGGPQETTGLDGHQGSQQPSVNKFQAYQASAARASRDVTEQSGVHPEHCSNQLSQLLHDISMVSRVDRTASIRDRAQAFVGGAIPGLHSSQLHNFKIKPEIHDGPDLEFKRVDCIPVATVPSISCSFISNKPSMARRHESSRQSTLEDDFKYKQAITNFVAMGFDLNATSGDSLRHHFQHDENFGDITSILYTDGNENRKQIEGDDDDGEFDVPSEKNEDQGEASSNFDSRRKTLRNQGLGCRDGLSSGGQPTYVNSLVQVLNTQGSNAGLVSGIHESGRQSVKPSQKEELLVNDPTMGGSH